MTVSVLVSRSPWIIDVGPIFFKKTSSIEPVDTVVGLYVVTHVGFECSLRVNKGYSKEGRARQASAEIVGRGSGKFAC